jgi:hypothetical protein
MQEMNMRTRVIVGALVLVGLGLAIGVPRLVSSHGVSAAEFKKADLARVATGTSRQRFAQLSQRHTNQCGLSGIDIGKIAVRGRLQGSCCNTMVYDHYVQQVSGLGAYAAVSEIPADPYDIPVSLAKRLIAYRDSITLNNAQQAIYKQATKMADEHGVCAENSVRVLSLEPSAVFVGLRASRTTPCPSRVRSCCFDARARIADHIEIGRHSATAASVRGVTGCGAYAAMA